MLLAALILLASTGCGNRSKPADAPKSVAKANDAAGAFVPDSPELIERSNRGVALMSQYKYADARAVFAELAKEHPDWIEAKINLAIATLNRQQEGDESAALAMLQEILKSEPDNLVAKYCAGVLLFRSGNMAEALTQFQAVATADPRDGYAAYNVALCLQNQPGKEEEALTWFQKAIAIDPYLRSAYYGASQLLRRMKRADEAGKMLQEFVKLDNNPRARLAEPKYTRMGPKAEAMVINQKNPVRPETPNGPFFRGSTALVADADKLPWAKRDPSRPASITACDIDGDGAMDLFIAGAIQEGSATSNLALMGQENAPYRLDREHPLAKVAAVNAALWGDYDNDGLTDVYLCRKGANQLWRQTAKNRWEDVTASTRTGGGDLDTVTGALFDADHDGDLDIFLVNADGPNELLNNDRNGSFTPLAKDRGLAGSGKGSRNVLMADLDTDRDLDLIVVNQSPPHEVYLNDRMWAYHPAKGFEKFISAELSAVVAGDIDADGQVELYSLGPAGSACWRRDDAGNWSPKNLVSAKPGQATTGVAALADIQGDGQLELLVSNADSWEVHSLTDAQTSSEPAYKAEGPKLAGWTSAVLGYCGGPSIVGMTIDQGPVLWKPAPERHDFLTLSFIGKEDKGEAARSNASGIGTLAAVRVGSRWTVMNTLGMTCGPGQSLQPIAVGTGGEPKIDFVRIDWSDGVLQTEMNLPACKHEHIHEENVMPSSCPILFAWDGEKFAFISDVLAVGGLGYFVQPGEYAPADPTENFLFPTGSLAPRDGRYQVKLTEPMEEVTYLDSAALVTYDLPPGWKLTLDERLAILGPPATGEPRFYRQERAPLRAVNERDEDVTAEVKTADGNAAPVGPLDPRFLGRLSGEHVLTLTFAEPLDSLPGKPVLLVDGWIEFPYSQTMFAAWQAKADYRAPTLEAQDASGKWQVLADQFGYPGGMPRQMSHLLAGLPPGCKGLRLRTNQEIYWDRLSVIGSEPCPEARIHRLPLSAASVAQTGFAPRSTGAQRRPSFDYDRRVPFAPVRLPAGFVTQPGSVDDLVTATDNALAIIGPGGEIHLEFAEPDSIPSGWTRRLVLELVGWCKDMDLYTKDGETIEPLPTVGKPSGSRDALHRRYNTLFQSGRR